MQYDIRPGPKYIFIFKYKEEKSEAGSRMAMAAALGRPTIYLFLFSR